jgi:dephospho-CoA kinase
MSGPPDPAGPGAAGLHAARERAADHVHARRSFVLRVGLTGGIASGKSTVARHFAEQGATIIDADAIAHGLIEPGGAAYDAVTREFGSVVARPDGTLDRARLGRLVFADPSRRVLLESILHPLIHAEENAIIARLPGDDGTSRIAVVNAALLIEAGYWRDYHRLVVVHCAEAIQVQRIEDRDHLSREEILARIATQMPTAEKLKLAHYAIDTGDGFEATSVRARAIYRHLQHDLVALADERP